MASTRPTILCSFCDSEFTAEKDLTTHLLMCGNKTDECPNCNKYIRRAIFAYHYENNCANLGDTPEDDDRQQTAKTNEPLVVVKCTHCQQNYQKQDSKIHKANCLENPANHSRDEETLNDENPTENSNGSSQVDYSNGIPCEWCDKVVPFDVYETHAIACRDKEHRRLEKQHQQREEDLRRSKEQSKLPAKQPAPKKPNVLSTVASSLCSSASDFLTYVKCQFCDSHTSKQGSSYHALHCKMNPRRSGVRA